ncbi:MAG: hypothetical protein KatS3mg105_0959 [Gemmatales bacterium]|nr:MAG: hypothetical protein KatS3mg105_0959 [Gemmatales bacterium]
MTIDRREFLATSAAAVAAACHHAGEDKNKKKYKKAVKIGMVRIKGSILDKFKLLKELGFDGVELDSPSNLDVKEVLAARDKTGLEIPGVVDSVHWRASLSDPDPAMRAKGVDALKTALRDAKTYGGTSVLLVPAVVKKDVPYDVAYERSQAEIRKVLPLAEKLGIKIAIENVWNNFLVSPLETARYVDEFKSPMVAVHFDVGNVLRYGWPEHWIRILGRRIVKLDIKEYSLEIANNEGLRKGFRVELLEGDCDWPAVMKALRDIDYTGWGTAEIPGGGRERLQEIAQRMDRIFAS